MSEQSSEYKIVMVEGQALHSVIEIMSTTMQKRLEEGWKIQGNLTAFSVNGRCVLLQTITRDAEDGMMATERRELRKALSTWTEKFPYLLKNRIYYDRHKQGESIEAIAEESGLSLNAVITRVGYWERFLVAQSMYTQVAERWQAFVDSEAADDRT